MSVFGEEGVESRYNTRVVGRVHNFVQRLICAHEVVETIIHLSSELIV